MYAGYTLLSQAVLSASFFSYIIMGLLPAEVQAQFSWMFWLRAMLDKHTDKIGDGVGDPVDNGPNKQAHGPHGVLLQSLGGGDICPPTFKGQVLALLGSGVVIGPFIPSTIAKVSIVGAMATDIGGKLGFQNRSRGMSGLWSAMYAGYTLLSQSSRLIGPSLSNMAVTSSRLRVGASWGL